jgi:hypothetical protein
MSRAVRPYSCALESVQLVRGPEALLGHVLERDHVVYESRLELSRLIFADFDRAVRRIMAQPFLLKAKVDGKIRKHIPDYFLVTDHGPVVVDVEPEHLLAKPTVTYTFAWTRRLVEARGWQYEVWSEAQPSELENLRFLAVYLRRGP